MILIKRNKIFLAGKLAGHYDNEADKRALSEHEALFKRKKAPGHFGPGR